MEEALWGLLFNFLGAFLGVTSAYFFIFRPGMRHYYGRIQSEKELLQKMHIMYIEDVTYLKNKDIN